MSSTPDQILVIDIEATCWQGSIPPAGQASDVIEIGLCPLDVGTLTRLDKRSILIRPERSTVSPFCTQLTTLTQEQVNAGVTFAEACAILEGEYRSAELVWASYGDYDRKQIARQCGETGVRYPFGPTHLNVKEMFAKVRKLPHKVGMAQAVKMCGRTLEGTHHRGHDDAWNIAGVLVEVLQMARG
jgi:inhibitor of KinA sporulation pathway (predicted exonuclease)